MKNKIVLSLTLIVIFVFTATAKIAIFANRWLSDDSKVAIRNFAENIELLQGKTVILDMSNFDASVTPQQLKTAITNIYNGDPFDRLEGAIFIGDLPIAYFEDNATVYHHYLCDLYFMDLDGIWNDNAKDGDWGGVAHTGYFDQHTAASRTIIDPEIWVTRIVPGAIPGANSEENVLLDYLWRVQSRMGGGVDNVQRRELIFVDDRTWPDAVFTGSNLGYGQNVTIFKNTDSWADSHSNYVTAVQSGYEYAYILEHGNPDYFSPSGIEGQFDAGHYLALSPISNVRFYTLMTCDAARYIVPNCIGALFAFTHNGLVLRGTTNTGYALTAASYQAFLGQDSTFGAAHKYAFIAWNSHLPSPASFGNELGTVVLGAGNLRLKPYPLVSNLYKQAEIGNSPLKGSFAFDNGTFTIAGSGTGIHGTSDQFKYVYHALNGDGEIIALVGSIQNSAMQFGLTIRESLAPNSKHISFLMQNSSLALIDRTSTGGGTIAISSVPVPAPQYRWIKLIRVGNVFTAYYYDGQSWYMLGTPQTITMNQNALIGLAVSSNANTATSEAVFQYVSFPAQEVASLFNIPKYQVVLGGNADFKRFDATSICNGTITHNQESRIRILSQANNVSFRWKVDSELNWDFLKLYFNGSLVSQKSGNKDWRYFASNISREEGAQYKINCIEFVYQKDGSVSSGQDKGWIKDLTFY